jgi:CBS domain-containing protein
MGPSDTFKQRSLPNCLVSTDEPIGRIVIENVFTVKGDALAADAAMLMVNKRISCLPVSMGEGAIGIVTEKDIIAKVVATGRDPKKVKVKEIMSSPLIMVPMDATIREAAEKMLKHQVRRLVITDETGKLMGLVTMTDIIRWIAEKQGNPAFVLRYLSESLGQSK